jgi:hypothetical protein
MCQLEGFSDCLNKQKIIGTATNYRYNYLFASFVYHSFIKPIKYVCSFQYLDSNNINKCFFFIKLFSLLYLFTFCLLQNVGFLYYFFFTIVIALPATTIFQTKHLSILVPAPLGHLLCTNFLQWSK